METLGVQKSVHWMGESQKNIRMRHEDLGVPPWLVGNLDVKPKQCVYISKILQISLDNIRYL